MSAPDQNPFISAFDAKMHRALGDHWARIALRCADIARDQWQKARDLQDEAERGFRELAGRSDDDQEEVA